MPSPQTSFRSGQLCCSYRTGVAHAGQHEFVDTSIEFYGTKYESAEINAKAAILLQNYQILVNSLEFNSGLDDVVSTADGILKPSGYNQKNGKIESQGNINYRNADKAYDYDTYNKTTPSYTTKGRDVQFVLYDK